MEEFEKLIPEMEDWNNGRGIDVQSWIGCEGTFRYMIAYSTFFWPKWKIYKDMVVPEDASEEYLEGWLAQCKGDKQSVEGVVNHLHIKDLHHAYCEDATHERLIFLGKKLREIYECKLKRDFPDRKISVTFDDAPQPDMMNYVLNIFQGEIAPNQAL